MTWVRIDDGFAEHPKIHTLSDRAFRLHVTALCYCGRNLTDGVIATPALRMLLGACNATRRHVDELVAAGVWDRDDDLRVHDFTDLNPKAVTVKREREKTRDRQRRHREARNSVTESVSNGVSHASPVPVPSQLLLKAVPADQDIEHEIDKIIKSLKDCDDGTRGVIQSIARRLPLSSIAKVRESCQTRAVGPGYAVNALKSELAEIEEVA